MYRDIFTNKWILTGIGFLIIFAGLCYLWYRYDTAPYRKQAAELDEMIRRSEKQRTATVTKPIEQVADAPADSSMPTADKPILNKDGAKTNTDKETVLVAAANDNAETVLVSPHGFGSYPEIPADYPVPDIFDYAMDVDHELIYRVLVKLWKLGIQSEGGQLVNGRVYPVIKGILYAEWKKGPIPPDGEEVEYLLNALGHPDDIQISKTSGPILKNNIPPKVKVLNFSDGIDPYEFLDLPQKGEN